MEINPIAILLAAFNIKSLQRPLVFVSMLVCGIAFLFLGGVMLYGLITELPQKQEIEWGPVLGILGLAGFLFSLAWVSFHLMWKAIKPRNVTSNIQ